MPILPAPPNIVFIYTDDHAAHAISAYGSRINETPNIDRLAEEGALFENMFVGNSICAPARATVLTGKHSHANGQLTNGQTFDGSQPTFPKMLQSSGYTTALIGKWHLKSAPTGFDHYEVLIGQGPYYNPTFRTDAGDTKHTGYTTTLIGEKSRQWLKEMRPKDEPFMLMVQHKAPHRNWLPGPDHLDLYAGQTLPEPPDLLTDWSNRIPAAAKNAMSIREHLRPNYDLMIGDPPRQLNDQQKAPWNAAFQPRNAAFERAGLQGDALTRWKYQRYIKNYLRTIAAVDDEIGHLMDELEAQGLLENTWVIYSSDQGFYLGDYGWYDKRWMYEPSFRTPLIVRPPTAAASKVTEMAQNIDLAPTMLDIAGAEIPKDMHGLSLLGAISGEGTDRQALYYRYYECPSEHVVPCHFGIRTDRFKLIRYPDTNDWELFDIKADPREANNLADDPAHARLRRNMERLLWSTQEEYGDSAGALDHLLHRQLVGQHRRGVAERDGNARQG